MNPLRWPWLEKLRELLAETAPPAEQMSQRLRSVERDVILPGGIWSQPAAVAGYWWAYDGGCSPDWMEHEVHLARQRRMAAGAYLEPGGDARLFSRVSS